MIKFENTSVYGFLEAIRGMRNPMNSWEKSDSYGVFDIGPKDRALMESLIKGGPTHAKFRRMIIVWTDIIAPLYWWKEFDTYKVGTVGNSCSTMHKIHAKEFSFDDFSLEHLDCFEACTHIDDFKDPFESVTSDMEDVPLASFCSIDILDQTIKALNYWRQRFLDTKDKNAWWQMIQLLPSPYNQRRTIMMNYEVLAKIHSERKDHKLDEWHAFDSRIHQLPNSWICIPELFEEEHGRLVNIDDLEVVSCTDTEGYENTFDAGVQYILEKINKLPTVK